MYLGAGEAKSDTKQVLLKVAINANCTLLQFRFVPDNVAHFSVKIKVGTTQRSCLIVQDHAGFVSKAGKYLLAMYRTLHP